MADIVMCTQTLCPNAGHCYRVQAPREDFHSMFTFHYTVGICGVTCAHYIPMYEVTTSDSTTILPDLQRDETRSPTVSDGTTILPDLQIGEVPL